MAAWVVLGRKLVIGRHRAGASKKSWTKQRHRAARPSHTAHLAEADWPQSRDGETLGREQWYVRRRSAVEAAGRSNQRSDPTGALTTTAAAANEDQTKNGETRKTEISKRDRTNTEDNQDESQPRSQNCSL